MKYVYLISAFIFLACCLLVWELRKFNEPGPDYTCQFDHMTKHFLTTEKQAKAGTYMVTVTQGHRTFMFRRDQLTACYEVESENNDD